MKSKRKPKNAPLKSVWVMKSRLGNLFVVESEPAPERLVEAAWCQEYRPAGLVEMSNPKARIAELEAERDSWESNARVAIKQAASEARGAALEEAAMMLESGKEGWCDVDQIAAQVRFRAATQPTMVAVERSMLESVLLRAGALLSLGTEFGDRRDEENVRDIIDSIAKALETK